jgi:hypothetical protein
MYIKSPRLLRTNLGQKEKKRIRVEKFGYQRLGGSGHEIW